MYMDESGIDDNEHRLYGWNEKGTRLHGLKPGYKKKRVSIMSALCNKQLQAPFIFEGYCTTEMMIQYTEQILLPTLKEGQFVIMDNASFHKSPKIKQLIESAGCKLIYLPPYSPDFNPIEHYWHKIKNSIRKLLSKNFSIDRAFEEVFAV